MSYSHHIFLLNRYFSFLIALYLVQLRRQNFPIHTFSSKKCDLLFRTFFNIPGVILTTTPLTPSQQTKCTAALFSTFFRPKIRWDISYALPLVPIICCLARSPDHVQVNSRRLQGLKKHLVILRSQGLDLEIDTIIGRSHHHPWPKQYFSEH